MDAGAGAGAVANAAVGGNAGTEAVFLRIGAVQPFAPLGVGKVFDGELRGGLTMASVLNRAYTYVKSYGLPLDPQAAWPESTKLAYEAASARIFIGLQAGFSSDIAVAYSAYAERVLGGGSVSEGEVGASPKMFIAFIKDTYGSAQVRPDEVASWLAKIAYDPRKSVATNYVAWTACAAAVGARVAEDVLVQQVISTIAVSPLAQHIWTLMGCTTLLELKFKLEPIVAAAERFPAVGRVQQFSAASYAADVSRGGGAAGRRGDQYAARGGGGGNGGGSNGAGSNGGGGGGKGGGGGSAGDGDADDRCRRCGGARHPRGVSCPEISCYKCGRKGHVRSVCPAGAPPAARGGPNPRVASADAKAGCSCLLCGGQHEVGACPLGVAVRTIGETWARIGTKKVVVLDGSDWGCGDDVVVASVSPEPTFVDVARPVAELACVDGDGAVVVTLATVDTGSSVNLFSRQVPAELVPGAVPALRSASGSALGAVASRALLNVRVGSGDVVRVGGFVVEWLAESSGEHVLLGRPGLKALGIGVDGASGDVVWADVQDVAVATCRGVVGGAVDASVEGAPELESLDMPRLLWSEVSLSEDAAGVTGLEALSRVARKPFTVDDAVAAVASNGGSVSKFVRASGALERLAAQSLTSAPMLAAEVTLDLVENAEALARRARPVHQGPLVERAKEDALEKLAAMNAGRFYNEAEVRAARQSSAVVALPKTPAPGGDASDQWRIITPMVGANELVKPFVVAPPLNARLYATGGLATFKVYSKLDLAAFYFRLTLNQAQRWLGAMELASGRMFELFGVPMGLRPGPGHAQAFSEKLSSGVATPMRVRVGHDGEAVCSVQELADSFGVGMSRDAAVWKYVGGTRVVDLRITASLAVKVDDFGLCVEVPRVIDGVALSFCDAVEVAGPFEVRLLSAIADVQAAPALHKVVLGARFITFDGWLYESGSRRIAPERVAQLRAVPRPRSPANWRSWAGMFAYVMAAVPGLQATMRPLTRLTKRGEQPTAADWDVFEQVRALLDGEPGLDGRNVLFDFEPSGAPVVVFSDASGPIVRSGVELLARGGGGGYTVIATQQGKLLATMGGAWQGSQCALGAGEKEALAVVKGLVQFSSLLVGRHFYVVVDHSNLAFWRDVVMSGRARSGDTWLRWATPLLVFDFTVVAVRGGTDADRMLKGMAFCDAGSRLEWPSERDAPVVKAVEAENAARVVGERIGALSARRSAWSVAAAVARVDEASSSDACGVSCDEDDRVTACVREIEAAIGDDERVVTDVTDAASSDAACERPSALSATNVLASWIDLSLLRADQLGRDFSSDAYAAVRARGPLRCRGGVWFVLVDGAVVPVTGQLDDAVVKELHVMTGHLLRDRLVFWIEQRVASVDIDKVVARVVAQCEDECGRFAWRGRPVPVGLSAAEPILAPMARLFVDAIVLPNSDGYVGAFTVVDEATKYGWAVSARVLDAASALASVRLVCSSFGLPLEVRTDNGTHFASDFKEGLRVYGVDVVNGLPYVPQSQSPVERYNGELKKLLAKSGPAETWSERLWSCTMWLNQVKAAGELTPFERMFGRAPTFASSVALMVRLGMVTELDELLASTKVLDAVKADLARRTREAQERARVANESLFERLYDVGDAVWHLVGEEKGKGDKLSSHRRAWERGVIVHVNGPHSYTVAPEAQNARLRLSAGKFLRPRGQRLAAFDEVVREALKVMPSEGLNARATFRVQAQKWRRDADARAAAGAAEAAAQAEAEQVASAAMESSAWLVWDDALAAEVVVDDVGRGVPVAQEPVARQDGGAGGVEEADAVESSDDEVERSRSSRFFDANAEVLPAKRVRKPVVKFSDL